mmetsp:Transcript_72175/g.192974  ORF Transcript_72175/g.192974 Transcript_72175/m.192974 type:complete len:155 (-) Transcript_72175:275-739(-)
MVLACSTTMRTTVARALAQAAWAQGGNRFAAGGCVESRSVMSTSNKIARIRDFDPVLARRMVEEQGLLIDCRTRFEFESGAPSKAILIPFNEIASRIKEVESLTKGDKDKEIVLFCQMGGRSAMAKQVLAEHGYRRVSNLGGLPEAREAFPGSW